VVQTVKLVGLESFLLKHISRSGICKPYHCAVTGIRDHVVQVVELKFNCFFLMPVVDTFPTRLREELEAAYMDDLDEVSIL
jgi:hypothetical protein